MWKWELLLVSIVAVVLCTGSVDGITRSEIMTRATYWSSRRVPYSQTAAAAAPDGRKYRTDCSGYVSMAWKTGTSYTTYTLPQVAKSISKAELKQGDILLGPGHTLIFDKWADGAKTKYWAFELRKPGTVATHHVISNYPYWGRSGFKPYRYKNL